MSKQTDYQFTNICSFRTNKIQCDTFKKLKNVYNIDISNFIRIAIKEKIKRDYPKLKEQKKENKYPWSC
jgi:hypothetical protein